MKTGEFLILETKGQETEQDKRKHESLDDWVKAVNAHSGFGRWRRAVTREPGEIAAVLAE